MKYQRITITSFAFASLFRFVQGRLSLPADDKTEALQKGHARNARVNTGWKKCRRTNDMDDLFRIVRGTYKGQKAVMVADPLESGDDDNVGFDRLCVTPGCEHPLWKRFKKWYFASPWYAQEEHRDGKHPEPKDYCLTVDLNDFVMNDDKEIIKYNLHIFPCVGGDNQKWRFCRSKYSCEGTLESQLWGGACQQSKQTRAPKTKPPRWCVTREDFTVEPKLKGEYIADGFLTKCEDGSESQKISFDYSSRK